MFEKTNAYKAKKVAQARDTIKTHRAQIMAITMVLMFSASNAAADANSSVNFTKIIDLMEEMPAVIAPIADIIAEMIVIMAYLAVAGLIIGIFGGIVAWINNSFGGFKFK